jgi:segregation and condensation protein B
MSLKAKLEAVIYAAEEPVTLGQLAALFVADALEWKAEHEAASAAESAEQGSNGSETLQLVNAEFDYPTGEAAAEVEIAEPAQETPAEASVEMASVEPAPVESTPATSVVDAESEARRLARQQDREVRTILRGLLDELIASYASDDRGIEIKEIAGGYRMATKPECHDAARMFVKSLKPALKLSLPALETLAVIAYKQPVTAPEVNEIRGVDSSGVFGSLLARKLIATAGRKQVIGRPILYKTTKEFLLRFGLKDVAELPSMEEFEKIAQLEFDEMEPAAEGEAAAEVNEDVSLEVDENPDEPSTAREDATAETADEETPESAEEEGATEETTATAGMADREMLPAEEPESTEQIEQAASAPADEAASTPAEVAPAAPYPLEQAETETVPHD